MWFDDGAAAHLWNDNVPTVKIPSICKKDHHKSTKKDELAKISLPTKEKFWKYRDTIACRHPALENVWVTIDDIKVRIEKAPDGIVQSMVGKVTIL